MPDVERNWGIWWEQGSRSGWITDDGVRATYTLAEARVRVVEFRQIAIWREAGFTYRVQALESEPTDRYCGDE